MITRTIFLVMIFAVLSSCGASDTEYFGYIGNGDKPTIGLRFNVQDGVVRSGAYSILSPEYPEEKEGVEYPLTNVSETSGIVSFHVKIKNGDKMIEHIYVVKIISKNDTTMDVQLSHEDAPTDPPLAIKLIKQ